MSHADDFARELQSLCKQHGYYSIGLSVCVDGRVEFAARPARASLTTGETRAADLHADSPLPTPTETIEQWKKGAR